MGRGLCSGRSSVEPLDVLLSPLSLVHQVLESCQFLSWYMYSRLLRCGWLLNVGVRDFRETITEVLFSLTYFQGCNEEKMHVMFLFLVLLDDSNASCKRE